MRREVSYIALIIMLVILSDCSRTGEHATIEGRISSETYRIESRFSDQPVAFYANSGVSINRDSHETDIYFLPDWPVERAKSINSPDSISLISANREGDGLPSAVEMSASPAFFKHGSTSGEIYLSFTLDNDLFDYTDYYYTSGVSLELFHPAISASPLAMILPGLRYSINFYSVALTQQLFTPLKLNKPEIMVGDRPFAATLTFSHQRISLQPKGHRRLQSEFILGTIGPASFGRFAQSVIHAEEPTGWKYQVSNDIVVNYSVRFDQGLYSNKNFELAVVAAGQAGTLHDNLSAGVFLQTGNTDNRYNSVFQTLSRPHSGKNRFRYYFSLEMMNKFVIYNATLLGGMLNRNSIYTLAPDQINRYVFTGSASAGIGYGRYSLEVSQVFLSPEFQNGRHHLWFRIKNTVYLN